MPKSFCAEIESILANYWWKNGKSRKGIHWCTWKNTCQMKNLGGLGFREMTKFNLAMLAKQRWRILTNPNSFFAQILKSKYFSNVDFLQPQLGNNPSHTWKSLWAVRGVLKLGVVTSEWERGSRFRLW